MERSYRLHPQAPAWALVMESDSMPGLQLPVGSGLNRSDDPDQG